MKTVTSRSCTVLLCSFALASRLVVPPPANAQSGGLAAYWNFDGNTIDQSGDGHDGIIHSTTWAADRLNRANMACGFNGTNAYIEAGASASLQLTNEISIVAWVNFSGGGPSNPRIVSCGGNLPSDDRGYEFLTLGNGATRKLQFFWGDQSLVSYYSIAEKSWHFVSAVGETNSLTIYVDGKFDSKLIIPMVSGFKYGNSPLFIGNKAPQSITFGDDLWGGAIDDVRIFSRALTEGEIQQMYASEGFPYLAISQTGTTGVVRLDFEDLIIGTDYQAQTSTNFASWTDFGLSFPATDTTISQSINVNPFDLSRFWRVKQVN